MQFGQLTVGTKFRVLHLKETTFTKVEEDYSRGAYEAPPSKGFNGKFYYRGKYNSVADYGGRWYWEHNEEVIPE